MAVAEQVSTRLTARKEAAKKAKRGKVLKVAAGVATAAMVGQVVAKAVRKRRNESTSMGAESSSLSDTGSVASGSQGGSMAMNADDNDEYEVTESSSDGIGAPTTTSHIQY